MTTPHPCHSPKCYKTNHRVAKINLKNLNSLFFCSALHSSWEAARPLPTPAAPKHGKSSDKFCTCSGAAGGLRPSTPNELNFIQRDRSHSQKTFVYISAVGRTRPKALLSPLTSFHAEVFHRPHPTLPFYPRQRGEPRFHPPQHPPAILWRVTAREIETAAGVRKDTADQWNEIFHLGKKHQHEQFAHLMGLGQRKHMKVYVRCMSWTRVNYN